MAPAALPPVEETSVLLSSGVLEAVIVDRVMVLWVVMGIDLG